MGTQGGVLISGVAAFTSGWTGGGFAWVYRCLLFTAARVVEAQHDLQDHAVVPPSNNSQ